MAIDTDSFSAALRGRGLDAERRRILIARLEDSDEAADITEPLNCEGFGRIRHFRRATKPSWPENPLPIDPAARALGLPPAAVLEAQVFQNAVCNWRCWYCYVDFPLLSGNADTSALLSADELLDLFLAVSDRPRVLDLSGGQPDLVPEWVVWMAEEIEARGLGQELYLWSDDNLSNDYFWSKLDSDQRSYLDGLPNYGKVCCFKGFDAASFAFNTAAEPRLFARQFELMRRLVKDTELDIYGYATFTSPDDRSLDVKMAGFVDQLQAIDRNLPLRLVPLRIETFTPALPRISTEHQRAMVIQDQAVAAWTAELERRFTGAERQQAVPEVRLRG